MALARRRACLAHRPRKPQLAILLRVLAVDRCSHSSSHCPALHAWIARDARLTRPARSRHLGRTDALQPDLLAGLAMDRAVNVVEGDGEAN